MVSWNKSLDYSQRLFLWLLAYSLLLVGCFIGFQYYREKTFKSEQLNTLLQYLNADILRGMEADGKLHIPSHPFGNLRVSVIDSCGRLVYDNMLEESSADNHLEREEVAKAMETGAGYTVRRLSESTGETYFYAATRGKGRYVVRSAVPYSLSLGELLRADMGFIWVMGAVTLAMCVLGYLATRRIGLHIRRLNHFAAMAERGERIYDTAPFPQDELGAISNHIVRLYANLQQANADRDKEHRTVLYQQQEKVRIKRQLTNNINHELKTPVASIQVCLETLLTHPEVSEARRTEFLQRCMANTERLKRLLTDVSLITRMDEAPGSIAKEPLDLAAIIAEVVEECEPLAANRGMSIVNGVVRPIFLVGNQSLLLSVFRNLIDNAISYSGGTKVEIALRRVAPGRAVITVADNGVGVPPEHLPHLFERFYRIDKGRSRAAGGTGLGLSIVKNSVHLHGGAITVSNRPAGGLLFTIILNCKADAPQ